MNGNKKQSSLINILFIWALFMLMWQFFGPKPQTAPPPAQNFIQQAQKKEAEAKDGHRSLSDRIKSFNAAIDDYDKVKNQEGDKPAGIDARYEELRLLAAMSELEQNSTAYWDRSEGILKDMEGRLAHKSATIVLL